MTLSKRIHRCSKPPIILGILLIISTLIYTTDYDGRRLTTATNTDFTTDKAKQVNKEEQEELKSIVRRKRYNMIDIKTTTEDMVTVEYDNEDVQKILPPSLAEDKPVIEKIDVKNVTDEYEDYIVGTTTPDISELDSTTPNRSYYLPPSFYKTNTDKIGNDIDYKDYTESKTTKGKDDIDDGVAKKEVQMRILIKNVTLPTGKPDVYGDYGENNDRTTKKLPVKLTKQNKLKSLKLKSNVKVNKNEDPIYNGDEDIVQTKKNKKPPSKIRTTTEIQIKSPKKTKSIDDKENLVLYFIKNSVSSTKKLGKAATTLSNMDIITMEDSTSVSPGTPDMFEGFKKAVILKLDKRKKTPKSREIYRRRLNDKDEEYDDSDIVKTKYQSNLEKNYEKLLQIVENAVPLIVKQSNRNAKLKMKSKTTRAPQKLKPTTISTKLVPKVRKRKSKFINTPKIELTTVEEERYPPEKLNYIEPDARGSEKMRLARDNEDIDYDGDEPFSTSAPPIDYEDTETTTTTTKRTVTKKNNQKIKQKKRNQKSPVTTTKSTTSTSSTTIISTTIPSTTSPNPNEERDVTDVIFPWVAVVFTKNSQKEEFTYACDAALVSAKSVLIAANCLKNKTMLTSKENILVFLGKRQQNDITIDDAYKVEKVKFHPKFFILHGREMRNNLALLILKKKVDLVELQTGVAKILDKERETQRVAAEAVVTDAVSTAWVASGDLIPIYFDIAKANKDCLLPSDKKFPFYFCAVHDIDVGTCPSHGGLYITQLSDDNSWYLKGIISEVTNKLSYCGERNIRFTDITKYDKWLKRNIV